MLGGRFPCQAYLSERWELLVSEGGSLCLRVLFEVEKVGHVFFDFFLKMCRILEFNDENTPVSIKNPA